VCVCVYPYIHIMCHVHAQDEVKEMRELYPNMAEEEARKVVASRAVADKLRNLQAAAAVAVRHAQSGESEKGGRERGRE
jgi:histidinol phosphatase-like enzyme